MRSASHGASTSPRTTCLDLEDFALADAEVARARGTKDKDAADKRSHAAAAAPDARGDDDSVNHEDDDADRERDACDRARDAADGDGDAARERDARDGRDAACLVTGRFANVLEDYIVFPRVLGEGCYGCVRECVHRATRRAFAVKSIDKSKVHRLDHLQNEVLCLLKLNHRGVMRMVDCREDSDYLHIVTERYTGGELFEVILDNTTETGCLSEREAAGITRSLLEAVAYLHENDVIHRDIKPENILFQSEADRTLKLIDFGLARRHHGREICIDNSVGTSYYMSPKVLRGEYDKSCDVWDVGTIVYILLCGYPPFNGRTDADVIEAIREGNLEFPDAQWRSKSDDAKEFIERLLGRDPDRRITAEEALAHPWVRSLGRKRDRAPRTRNGRLRYLSIP